MKKIRDKSYSVKHGKSVNRHEINRAKARSKHRASQKQYDIEQSRYGFSKVGKHVEPKQLKKDIKKRSQTKKIHQFVKENVAERGFKERWEFVGQRNYVSSEAMARHASRRDKHESI